MSTPPGRYHKAVHLKISARNSAQNLLQRSVTLTCTLELDPRKRLGLRLTCLCRGTTKSRPDYSKWRLYRRRAYGWSVRFEVFLKKKWIHTTQIEVPKITTFRLGVPKYNSIVVTIFIAFLPAFTWCIFLAPINSTSRFFLPANIVRSYLGLRAVELGMGFIVLCHLLESLYTFSSCQRHCMVFFVGVRRGVFYFFFFSFGAAAHLPNMRNISLRGPSGRVAQWRTAVPLYFQKSLSLGTTSFFFSQRAPRLSASHRSSTHRPLKWLRSCVTSLRFKSLSSGFLQNHGPCASTESYISSPPASLQDHHSGLSGLDQV